MPATTNSRGEGPRRRIPKNKNGPIKGRFCLQNTTKNQQITRKEPYEKLNSVANRHNRLLKSTKSRHKPAQIRQNYREYAVSSHRSIRRNSGIRVSASIRINSTPAISAKSARCSIVNTWLKPV